MTQMTEPEANDRLDEIARMIVMLSRELGVTTKGVLDAIQFQVDELNKESTDG